MHLEVGKYYKTRDGRKVKVVEVGAGDVIRVDHGGIMKLWHYKDGTCNVGDGSDDLISEWKDEPVEIANMAEQAANYEICITVSVGDVTVIYDGRD